jgi:hypothetical protein
VPLELPAVLPPSVNPVGVAPVEVAAAVPVNDEVRVQEQLELKYAEE